MYIVLTASFPGKLWLAVCHLIFLTRSFGAKIYRLDALPGVKQQEHAGPHLFCIHYTYASNEENWFGCEIIIAFG